MNTRILFWLVPDNFTKKIFLKLKKKYPYSIRIDFKGKNDLATNLLNYKKLFKSRNSQFFSSKLIDDIYKENINEWLDNYYSRRMNIGINIFTLREIFKKQSEYILNYLSKYKFTHLVISADSGIGIDFLTYKIAKKVGIKTIFLFGEHRNFFFYTYDKDDWGKFKFAKKKLNQLNKNNFNFEEIFNYRKPFYMNAEFLLASNNILKIFYKSLRSQLGGGLKNLNMHFFNKWVEQKKLVFLSKNLPKKYIYFSLNHQPESTTIAWGKEYIDQISAIEKLRKIVPKKIKIIVKDHPAQLDLYHRDKFFNQRLKLLDNVFISNCRDDTKLLIEKSICVALIYGTTGWEALQKNKPVISFGQNWYNNIHGVHRFNKNLNFNKIQNFKFNKKIFYSTIEKLMTKSAPGMVYKSIQSNSVDFSTNFKKEKFVESKEINITYNSIIKLL